VLGEYDVVVIGGGTSGCAAGIGAARQGRRVLVVEYLHGLGGVGTLGLIGRYHCGYQIGFTKEVDEATLLEAPNDEPRRAWDVVRKMEWWRTTLRREGVDIWLGAAGCGALVIGGRVCGVVVATPERRGIVLAKTVVDATGNADIAAAAGAACMYIDASCVAVQGAGLPIRELGANYTNTDFTVTDETDMIDVWHVLVYTKIKYGDAFDMAPIIDTRERRRVVGDSTLTLLDVMNRRTYPDTIAQSISNWDSHGYFVDSYLALHHPGRTHCYTPYRCLLPRGLDGVVVAGIGVSVQRDALPFVRMQADLQNQGYAAGVAAAMAAARGGRTRTINIRKLQRHLVHVGNLPASVLTDGDSLPLSAEEVAAAVERMSRGYEGVAAVLAHPDKALPLLREAYRNAPTKTARLAYAHVLAMMGDATGLDPLIAAVEDSPDMGDGYEYRGMGHDNARRRMSQIDSYILALGRTKDRRVLPAVLRKLRLLEARSAFSHHYAVAVALETLKDPAAAGPLAELLSKPGMSGHAIRSLEEAIRTEHPPLHSESRRKSFRDIILARALFRCGDKDHWARRILEEYTRDLRGHFARHARAVLEAKKAP